MLCSAEQDGTDPHPRAGTFACNARPEKQQPVVGVCRSAAAKKTHRSVSLNPKSPTRKTTVLLNNKGILGSMKRIGEVTEKSKSGGATPTTPTTWCWVMMKEFASPSRQAASYHWRDAVPTWLRSCY
jgi:hypothetical protein